MDQLASDLMRAFRYRRNITFRLPHMRDLCLIRDFTGVKQHNNNSNNSNKRADQ